MKRLKIALDTFQKIPKLKPPRYDLRKRKTLPDKDLDGVKKDPDLKSSTEKDSDLLET